MHLPVIRTGLVGLTALVALVAAFAAVLYSGSGNAEAATYAPTSAVKMCNALAADFPSSIPANDADLLGNPACTDVLTASANTNFTVTFSVAGGHSNFGSSVITNAPGTTATDAGIPDGQKVGGLRSDVTLSLLNGPCGTALVAEFVLYDADTDSTGTITPDPEGTPNRWASLATDTNLDEIADSTSPAITQNLSIYETLFTPTGGSYIQPSARYTGLTRVPSGGDWQLLSFFQVAPGSLDAFNNPSDSPHTFARVSHAPTTGNLSLSILNDPTAVLTSVSPIHDFCSPLVVQTMLLGVTPGGSVRYTTPAAGTMGFANFSYGQRDLDGDGLENAYDTCPAAANTGDTDGDGIDNACDPTGVNTGLGDHDSDGFANRQDNCPLVANGVPNQIDSEVSTANVYTAVAPDGGTKSDAIGDACETDDTVANGAFVQSYNLVVKCIGATDGDGDGYCAAQDINDASACVPNASGTACTSGVGGYAVNGGMDSEYKFVPPTVGVSEAAVPANGSSCVGAGANVDNDADTVVDDGCPGGGQGDRVGGNHEAYLGSNPLKRCGFTAGGQAWSENWAFDLIESDKIDISDVLALKVPFNGLVPAVDKHFDIIPTGKVDISDVLALKVPFNSTCIPE